MTKDPRMMAHQARHNPRRRDRTGAAVIRVSPRLDVSGVIDELLSLAAEAPERAAELAAVLPRDVHREVVRILIQTKKPNAGAAELAWRTREARRRAEKRADDLAVARAVELGLVER